MALPPLTEDHLKPLPTGNSNKGKSNEWLLNKKNLTAMALRLLLALVLAFFINQLKLDYFESYLYDLRVRLRPAPATSDMVSMVMIDEVTIQNLKKAPEAAQFKEVMQKLRSLHPNAVVFDYSFDDFKGTPEEKAQFVAEAKSIPELYVMTEDLGVPGQAFVNPLPAPLNQLRMYPGLKSADISNFAKDGVSRRMMVAYQGQDMLHLHLAKKINPELNDKKNIRGLFEFLDSDQMYINFRPTGSYPAISFSQILESNFPEEWIRGRIVLIGQDLKISKLVKNGSEQPTERDYVRTPYSRDVLAMTSTELHANMLDTLILNNAPTKAPQWLNFFFVAVISIITVYVVFSMRPLVGLVVLASSFFGYGLIAYLAFWPFGLWISMAHPWLAIFLCYYFFIPYRLIIENRRSWEIYQKHNLLKQVEELKTNFISMMSHDLKTPIARIIGMTDVILRDQTPLSNQQREAVDTIKHSSDDLLKFINSILNYGRIESQSLQLHKQSKDVNQLLDEVIFKHEFLAKLKKIQVIKEYETLFPIKVDPDLIKQVFSNLIENAIKYSPDETKILVSTEEKDGLIVIQVADQGHGIPPEDLPNLFMKFYRSQQAKSSPIKGSGLGLYLAKYFVELHGGRVFVESTYGQGSTFTIELPLG
jgi:hypothetical protein